MLLEKSCLVRPTIPGAVGYRKDSLIWRWEQNRFIRYWVNCEEKSSCGVARATAGNDTAQRSLGRHSSGLRCGPDWRIAQTASRFAPKFLSYAKHLGQLLGPFSQIIDGVIEDSFTRNWLDLLCFMLSGLPADRLWERRWHLCLRIGIVLVLFWTIRKGKRSVN